MQGVDLNKGLMLFEHVRVCRWEEEPDGRIILSPEGWCPSQEQSPDWGEKAASGVTLRPWAGQLRMDGTSHQHQTQGRASHLGIGRRLF